MKLEISVRKIWAAGAAVLVGALSFGAVYFGSALSLFDSAADKSAEQSNQVVSEDSNEDLTDQSSVEADQSVSDELGTDIAEPNQEDTEGEFPPIIIPEDAPKRGGVYIGVYEGEEIAFSTDCYSPDSQESLGSISDTYGQNFPEGTVSRMDYPYVVHGFRLLPLQYTEDQYEAADLGSIDYRRIDNTKLAYSADWLEDCSILWGGIYLKDVDDSRRYLTFHYAGLDKVSILEIDPESDESRVVWNYSSIDDVKTEKYQRMGNVWVYDVIGDYLFVKMMTFFEGDGGGANAVLIINRVTGNDHYLGEAADIRVDQIRGVYFYQELSAVEEVGEIDSSCLHVWDRRGYEVNAAIQGECYYQRLHHPTEQRNIVYRPDGPVITSTLP